MGTSLLELRGICKRFGASHALSGVDFSLQAGEIHALCGENGAGKSTLMNIIDGIHQPDAGEIVLNGCTVAIDGPAQAMRLGIGLVHLEIALCGDATVAENIFMPEANSALGAAQAKVETKKNIKVMCCDVNAKILDMIKSGDVFGAINPNQGMQGYMGMMMLFLAKNPGLIDPMNDAKRNGTNPMAVPFLDNGLAVVSKANADDFYWDKYLARRGTKGISE